MGNPFGIDFSAIGDAMKQLQGAYEEGLGAMNSAQSQATADIDPSHKITTNIHLSATVEGKNYDLEAKFEFILDLNSVLNTETGDIMGLLGGLGVDLSSEEMGQVAEQLGQPRIVGKLENYDLKNLEIHSDSGKENPEINPNGTLLLTVKDEQFLINFESVLAFPSLDKTLYYAVPSMEKMQENIVVSKNQIGEKIKFSRTEKDKDNLKVEGDLIIEEL